MKIFKNYTYSCLETLQNKRWSRRSFSNDLLEPKILKRIFSSGKEVASSYNEQPWRIILASRLDGHFNDLYQCLSDYNQEWTKNTPYLGLVLAKKTFEKNNKVNKHNAYDAGAFMAVASLKAVEQGVFIHQMAGFSSEKIKENFEIPEDFEPLTMFVLGKPGKITDLPEKIQRKESPKSTRNPIDSFVYSKEWEKPYTF